MKLINHKKFLFLVKQGGILGLKWLIIRKIILYIGLNFFQAEIELDKTETLKVIVSLLSNTKQFGLITIFVNFIASFSCQFVQTLNFFQQEKKPVFAFVENQLQNLSAYIESNMIATSFGSNLDLLINNYHFRLNDFYSV